MMKITYHYWAVATEIKGQEKLDEEQRMEDEWMRLHPGQVSNWCRLPKEKHLESIISADFEIHNFDTYEKLKSMISDEIPGDSRWHIAIKSLSVLSVIP